MSANVNHKGWDTIFSSLDVLNKVNANGYFDISAQEIKDVSGREARLMAKIDFREQLPGVMSANKLSILAINNGNYRIAKIDPFISLKSLSSTPSLVKFPQNILTLDPGSLTCESATLDVAFISGILESVFGEKVHLTIRGRIRSGDFNLALNGVSFPVSGVQIEVDGGYEGNDTVNLVEAKIGGRNNISIRQLAYPQMEWERVLVGKKRVRTFICFYEEPVLRFIPVVYQNGTCLADHAKEVSFIIERQANLDLLSIDANANASPPVEGVPFPQANRFETVLAMFAIAARNMEMTKEELASDFDIDPDPRHIDYYFNAMRWLGLVESKDGIIRLTEYGKSVSVMHHAERIESLAGVILREPIFNFVLKNEGKNVPDRLFDRWGIGHTTKARRLATVRAWVHYFKNYISKVRG